MKENKKQTEALHQIPSVDQVLNMVALAVPILAFISFSTVAFSAPPIEEPAPSRWIDPLGRKPMSYAVYHKKLGEIKPFQIDRIYSSPPKLFDNTLIDMLVNTSLYSYISDSLYQYISDLENLGYTVVLDTVSGGEPSDLRGYLFGQISNGLVGVVFIGDLPIAWYEMDVWGHEEFPFDLYYMDLDGQWLDTDENGIYDGHIGEVTPEIWVGRLTASPLTYGGAEESELINHYFSKAHRFRIGTLSLNRRALLYIDDDFVSDADEWDNDLSLMYNEQTVIVDTIMTSASDYKERLRDNYEWIQVHAHSSPYGHAFVSGEEWHTVYNYEIPGIDPLTFFYMLYACSNARYVADDYMGGWYIFSDTCGLAAFGSTKTGGMFNFESLYRGLGNNKCLGEAFRDWCGIWSETYPEWFYGLTLLGDPTLIISSGLVYSSHLVDDDQIGESSGNSDGTVDAGETIELALTLSNYSLQAFAGVSAYLSTTDPYVTVIDSLENFGNIGVRDSASSLGNYVLNVSANCPDKHEAVLTLKIEDVNHQVWMDDIRIVVGAPLLYFVGMTIDNDNGEADPGDTVDVFITLKNFGAQEANAVTAVLESDNPYISIEDSVAYYGVIPSQDSMESTDSYRFSISSSSPVPHFAVLHLRISTENGQETFDSFTLSVSGSPGFIDHMEKGRNGWLHCGFTPNYKDEWHQSYKRDHTVGGSISWKCGDPGEGPYCSGQNSFLMTPWIKLESGYVLSFWHWCDIEPWYDGGIVEMDTGAGWFQISPVGGYPYIIDSPFPTGTPCFSGTHDWEKVVFDLGDYSGKARFRFHFASDGGLTQEGWYIDDLTVNGGVGVEEDVAAMNTQLPLKLVFSGPNPFASLVAIEYALSKKDKIQISIYDAMGRSVRTIVDGLVSPGHYKAYWDGRDNNGGQVGNGIYFWRFETKENAQTQKIILLK